jgi:hypothetical protein
VECIALEYQYLLTAQLETQKAFFEDEMKKLKLEKRTKIKKLEKDCKVRQEKIQI